MRVKAIQNYKSLWQEKPQAYKIIESAHKLARLIADAHGVEEKHKKELLGVLIWKITEANGKHNTRFVSEGVYHGKHPIEHEHVHTKKSLIVRILQSPRHCDVILRDATGCLVTRQEHLLLAKQKAKEGWERYNSAGMKVFDRKTMKWLSI